MSNEIAKKESTTIAPVVSMAQSMIDVIAKVAVDPNGDVDKLERLLNMQEKLLEKEAEQKFNKAMMLAQSKMPNIVAQSTNQHTRSKYAELKHILPLITPVYTDQGFSLSFGTGIPLIEGWLRVTCDICHTDGFCKSFYQDLPPDDTGSSGKKTKTQVHGVASSDSYGRRYLIIKIFNLSIGDEDNDGNYQKPIPMLNSMHGFMLANDSLGVFLLTDKTLSQENQDKGISELIDLVTAPDKMKGATKINHQRMNEKGRDIYNGIKESILEDDSVMLKECFELATQSSKMLLKFNLGEERWSKCVELMR